MKIGVDCDGVLTDLSAYVWHYGELYFKKKPVNKKVYDVAEIFGCTKKQELKFWLKYFWPYCRKWPPRDKAAEVLNNLSQEGHELYEITARMFVTQKGLLGWYSRHVLLRWIHKWNFSFLVVFFCIENTTLQDKLDGCRKYGVEVMIDDKPDVALCLAEEGIRVLLFDTEYNKEAVHKNIVRVHGWQDIYTAINSMEV